MIPPRTQSDVVEVCPGVYRLPTDFPEVFGAPLAVYLTGDADDAALIDAGMVSTPESSLWPAIASLGIPEDAIHWLVLTHGHVDHMGGAAEVVGRTGAMVAAPLEDVAWVEAPERQWHELWADYPGVFDLGAIVSIKEQCGAGARVDRPLRDGDVVAVGGTELEVVRTRGHSTGHCAFFDSARGALYSGDLIQRRGTRSLDGTTVFPPVIVDVADYVEGLKRLAGLPFDLLLPAHAEPVDRGEGLRWIGQSLGFVDWLRDFAQAVVNGATTVTVRDFATRLGEALGANPPVTSQMAITAQAALEDAAHLGIVEPSWTVR